MAPKANETVEPPSRWERIRLFIIKNFLPLAFLVALTWALAWPVPGSYLAKISVLGNVKIFQVVPMAIVFLITGLQLDTAAMKRALALRNAPSIVYGFVAILLITPCLGFLFLEVPLDPYEFSIGLTIFCVAPTTLGVGVALTVACGGNDAVALLLTVGTNALAVVTMPPELRLLLQGVQDPKAAAAAVAAAASPPPSLPPSPLALAEFNGTGSSPWPPPPLPPSLPAVAGEDRSFNLAVSITDLLVKLAITVLVPFIIGKGLREAFPAVLAFAKAHKVPLSLFSTSCLAFVVWQTLSSARDLLLAQSAGPVLAMMGLAVGMHMLYLAFNYLVVWWLLRPPLKEAVAVVIMASQKSAPVAVTVIAYLVKSTQQQGLLALPAVVGQLAQIFIGSGLAAWLSGVVKRHDASEKAQAALAAAEAEAAAAEALEAGGGAAAAEAAAAAGEPAAADGAAAAVKVTAESDASPRTAADTPSPAGAAAAAAAAASTGTGSSSTRTRSSSSSSRWSPGCWPCTKGPGPAAAAPPPPPTTTVAAAVGSALALAAAAPAAAGGGTGACASDCACGAGGGDCRALGGATAGGAGGGGAQWQRRRWW